MANNYTEFSEMIPCETQGQIEWLENALTGGSEGYPVCEFDREGDGVWVYSEDIGDLGALADVVSAFQLRFDVAKPWTLTWAGTCSEPLLGNFGGGGVVVYKGKAHWMNTWDWCAAEVLRLQA